MWFTIFTQDDCQWCTRVKELLSVYGMDFYEKDLSDKHNKGEFLNLGFRTVPQVYVNYGGEHKHIGGYETTKDYLRNKFFEDHPDKEQVIQQLKELND